MKDVLVNCLLLLSMKTEVTIESIRSVLKSETFGCPISDHNVVVAALNCKSAKGTAPSVESRKLTDDSLEAIKAELKKIVCMIKLKMRLILNQ